MNSPVVVAVCKFFSRIRGSFYVESERRTYVVYVPYAAQALVRGNMHIVLNINKIKWNQTKHQGWKIQSCSRSGSIYSM